VGATHPAAASECKHRAAGRAVVPATCLPCLTPGTGQGMSERGLGLFYFPHAQTENPLAFPTGLDSRVAPTIAIAVGVLVPLTSLLLLACLLRRYLRHLRDPERNPAWPCWVGLSFPGVLQGSLAPVTGLSARSQLCPATPGMAAPRAEGDEGISPQPDSWEGET